MDLRSDIAPNGKAQCDRCGHWRPEDQVAIQGCAICYEMRNLCQSCARVYSFTDNNDRCSECVPRFEAIHG